MTNGDVALRDSKNPAVPAHTFTQEEWTAFTRGVKAGEFDYSPVPFQGGTESATIRFTR